MCCLCNCLALPTSKTKLSKYLIAVARCERLTLQSLMETLISMEEKLEEKLWKLEGLDTDPEREEREGEQLQGNDGDKCFQRQVEATGKKVEKTKKLSSMTLRSPKRKRFKKR